MTEERDQTAAALARQTAQFQVLQRVAAAINSTLDLEEIYDVALRTFDDLFGSHHALILLVEPGGDTLRVVASRGYENQAIGGRVRIGTGAVGLVAERRRILQVSNLGQQRAYASAQRRQMMKAGRGADIGDTVPVPGLPNAESQIAIPLLIGDELVGVLSIESPVRHAFDDHDRSLATIVANQVASAIRNAQLYEERLRAATALQAANASLEARVAERTAALERELRVAEELLSDARSRVEGPLVGDSAAVRGLREAVSRAASQPYPVLLTGPPGAGKEAVARALHAGSGRKGAFIYVSCPELHSQSLQARPAAGAPTPSSGRSLASKFELACGGTLFLDAVHELLPEHQRELLELAERHRPSGPDARERDVRLVASTTGEVPRGGELFTVLAQHEIAVPALKDRRDDIPALVEHFLKRQARRLGRPVDAVSPDSMRRLVAYAWPGNVQELHSVLERAILVSRSPIVEIDEDLLDATPSVGSYRLMSRLGSGGMGEVWLARHRLLARPAAVKLIRPESQTGRDREELIRRFEREAQVTAGLRSPHTVQLYDFGVDDHGGFYYVMELLKGLDLQQIVSRFGPQPVERAIVLLRHACRSLAEAHEHGLVHRDIKPANLFVARLGSEYDYLKVLDFGIVKDRPGQELTGLSTQHILQGTPAFMAPEVVMGEGPIDGRTDLYALACAAYWVLTGHLVFHANTPAQMLLHHAQTRPEPPSRMTELPIPPDLDAVLLRCLEKDPAKRPSSALELEGLLAGVRSKAVWTDEDARAWWSTHAPDIIS